MSQLTRAQYEVLKVLSEATDKLTQAQIMNAMLVKFARRKTLTHTTNAIKSMPPGLLHKHWNKVTAYMITDAGIAAIKKREKG